MGNGIAPGAVGFRPGIAAAHHEQREPGQEGKHDHHEDGISEQLVKASQHNQQGDPAKLHPQRAGRYLVLRMKLSGRPKKASFPGHGIVNPCPREDGGIERAEHHQHND